jgi:hypothetical protein
MATKWKAVFQNGGAPGTEHCNIMDDKGIKIAELTPVASTYETAALFTAAPELLEQVKHLTETLKSLDAGLIKNALETYEEGSKRREYWGNLRQTLWDDILPSLDLISEASGDNLYDELIYDKLDAKA